jgi:outer membrane biosynthesis protein TonB
MRSQIPASLSLLLLTLSSAWAQPADEFFHGGAQRYLTNDVPGALEVVTNGLQRFPDDAKLKKLYELLNQQQQQQQNQKDQKDQKDQKQEQKQDQNQKDQPTQDQQKKTDEQKKQSAQDKKDQSKTDQQPKSGDKSKDKPDEQKEPGEPQQVAAHAMTPQEAKQLLDAQKDDEQVLQFQPQGEPKKRERLLKDW